MKYLIGILGLVIMLGMVGATNATYTSNDVANIIQLQQIVAAQNTIINTQNTLISNLTNTIQLLKINLTTNYGSIYPELTNLSQGAISKTYIDTFATHVNSTFASMQSGITTQFTSFSTTTNTTVDQKLSQVNTIISQDNATFASWNGATNNRIATIANTITTNNNVLVGAINQVNANENNGTTDDLYLALLAIVMSIVVPFLMIRFMGGKDSSGSS